MSARLTVSVAGRAVGALSEDHTGRMTFAYAPEWLTDAGGFPISVSLPFREEPFEGGAGHAFFANLLPEGRVRTAVTRRLGISEEHDFALLAAIGGDCAGALTVTNGPPPAPEWRYRPFGEEELRRFLRHGTVLPQVSGQDLVRLSLAGVQDKLPVHRGDGGALGIPLGSSPSTHLLKFASREYKHLPANEALVTALARELGLPVVDLDLLDIGGEWQLVVTRYDRAKDDTGRPIRLHQEDMCQALGRHPTRKYEEEGGPGFARCFAIVADHSIEPALDTAALLRWLAFCALAGNSDGHAKNLSLVRTPGGGLRLAPFYDLVCTAAYPVLDRRLAMKVGDRADPGETGARDWRTLASRVGVRPGYLVDLVVGMAEALPHRAEEAARRFRDRYGDSPALTMIPTVLRKRARRALRLLGR